MMKVLTRSVSERLTSCSDVYVAVKAEPIGQQRLLTSRRELLRDIAQGLKRGTDQAFVEIEFSQREIT